MSSSLDAVVVVDCESPLSPCRRQRTFHAHTVDLPPPALPPSAVESSLPPLAFPSACASEPSCSALPLLVGPHLRASLDLLCPFPPRTALRLSESCTKDVLTMKIYTKTGDEGETSLFSGKRVAKNHDRVSA